MEKRRPHRCSGTKKAQMIISSKELERWGQKLNQQTQGGQQSQQLKTTLEDKQTTHTGIDTQ